MRKGTFSVQKATANSSAHNSRKTPPKYLIGLESGSENYYELIQNDNDFILEAQQIYKEKIKQNMQKKQVENLIQETVLTLQPNQNENDVKELFKKLNKKYGGHELLEVSVHRDEGHFERNGIAYYPTKNILNKNGEWYICSDPTIAKPKKDQFDKKVDITKYKKVYNYHAHAKFSMFDKSLGKSARMQKKDMSSRIKFVSEQLGLDYAPDKATSRIKKSVNLIKDEHLATSNAKRQIVQIAKKRINALEDEKEILEVKVCDLEEKINSRPNMEDYEHISKQLQTKKENENKLRNRLEIPADVKADTQDSLFQYILKLINELRTSLKSALSRNETLENEIKELKEENLKLKEEDKIDEIIAKIDTEEVADVDEIIAKIDSQTIKVDGSDLSL